MLLLQRPQLVEGEEKKSKKVDMKKREEDLKRKKKEDEINNFRDLVDMAKSQGWMNVTGVPLVDSFVPNKGTSAEVSMRSQVTSIAIFNKLCSHSMVDHICESTRGGVPSPTRGNSWQVRVPDIKLLLSMIVQCCGMRAESWTEYLEVKDRVGMNTKAYEKLRKCIAFNPAWLFNELNRNFHNILSVGGEAAIDETMLRYEGESQHLIFIPRKPTPSGIRLYLECFQLQNTNQPVCFTLIPDIETITLPPGVVLRRMCLHHPADARIAITADSFFSSTGWLESNKVPTLFSVAANDIASLYPLFTKDLEFNDHRSFSNGKMTLSFWFDNTTMVCGTNRFFPSDVPQQRLIGVNTSGYVPIMDIDQLSKLSELSLDALRGIAKKMGESTGN